MTRRDDDPDLDLEPILDLLHDGVADQTSFAPALAAIATLAGTEEAALWHEEVGGGQGALVASHGWPEDAVARICAQVHLRAIVRRAQRMQPPPGRAGGVLVDGEGAPLGLGLVHDGTVVGALALGGRDAAAPARAGAVARALAPHLARSLVATRRLAVLQAQSEACRGGLDRLGLGVLLLQPDGRILFANEAAERTLVGGGPLGRAGDRIVGKTREAAEIVRRIVRAPAATPQDGTVRDRTGAALALSWVALSRACAIGEATARLVVVRGSGDREVSLAAAAAARYALTAAEARVLARVVAGDTVAEAADRLGVAATTVKTHLAAIFRKSSTSRRVELVRRTLALDGRYDA